MGKNNAEFYLKEPGFRGGCPYLIFPNDFRLPHYFSDLCFRRKRKFRECFRNLGQVAMDIAIDKHEEVGNTSLALSDLRNTDALTCQFVLTRYPRIFFFLFGKHFPNVSDPEKFCPDGSRTKASFGSAEAALT